MGWTERRKWPADGGNKGRATWVSYVLPPSAPCSNQRERCLFAEKAANCNTFPRNIGKYI
jgi:hypothetical protein